MLSGTSLLLVILTAAVADDCPELRVGTNVSSHVELIDAVSDDTPQIKGRRGRTQVTDVQLR